MSAASTAPKAPPLDEALPALFRRHARAVTFLVVRVIAVGILIGLLLVRAPSLQRQSAWLCFAGSVLAIWPFYTTLGRVFAWRIVLGRAYAREKRWSDAEQTLRPLARIRYQVFDATGEGRYWLATALRESGRADEAGQLFQSLAQRQCPAGPGRERAAAEVDGWAEP